MYIFNSLNVMTIKRIFKNVQTFFKIGNSAHFHYNSPNDPVGFDHFDHMIYIIHKIRARGCKNLSKSTSNDQNPPRINPIDIDSSNSRPLIANRFVIRKLFFFNAKVCLCMFAFSFILKSRVSTQSDKS